MTTRTISGFSERGKQHLINELCTIYQPLFVARYLSEIRIKAYLREIKESGYYMCCDINTLWCDDDGKVIVYTDWPEQMEKRVTFDEGDFEWNLNLTDTEG